jgi:hypothetical protein
MLNMCSWCDVDISTKMSISRHEHQTDIYKSSVFYLALVEVSTRHNGILAKVIPEAKNLELNLKRG